jgi:hypothetical protein
MIFFFGTRRLGRVFEAGNARVETDFFCVNFLPLVPLSSYFCVGGGLDDQAIPRVGASVIAGYLRAWGLVGGAVALGFGIQAAVRGEVDARAWFALGAAALVAAVAWLVVGKLGDDARARLAVYADAAEHPIDVALLREDLRERLREPLWDTVAEGARSLAPSTYRSAPDPARDWQAIAVDPSVRDRAFLRAAMTLARVDGARGEHGEHGEHTNTGARAELARTHDAIWAKLKTMEADRASKTFRLE